MADAEEEIGKVGEECNNEAFRSAIYNRKLRDNEKLDLISDWESYPALWMTSQAFSREEKTRAVEAMSVKFSLTEESLKKVLHSLRSSLVREVRRAIEDEKFQSCWKFYRHMSFMKEDIVRSFKQEAAKEWSNEEINTLIELYESHPVLWDHHSKEYRDRNLRKLAMDNIKESLGKRTEEEIKSQWHTLKTIHQREHKRQEGSKKSGSATSDVYKTKCQFFESMSFILSSNEVDDSQSTWTKPESEVLPTHLDGKEDQIPEKKTGKQSYTDLVLKP